ncbi:MAG TPA: putative cytokinetic ring protein SteA [Marmoricola sp.]|nr:putative cytokinetic ring protein SteA [Marmoricola sp.]
MKFLPRHAAISGTDGVTGTIRSDRRLATVLRKARPGDIIVIDHLDLDRTYAEALLGHGVGAVVNAARFISGRYPNLGPELLAGAGVVLIDEVGPEVFKQVKDGARGRVHAGTLYLGERAVAEGRSLDLDDVRAQMDNAREGISSQLQSFAHNTAEFLRREQALLLHGQGVPDLRTTMEGRPVVVVVRDFDHEADLRRMRRFIREQRPVLVGVDGGADALLAVNLRPDLVVVGEGGFSAGALPGQAVSDEALSRAGEVLLHADASDRVVGAERLDRLGVRPQRISASGSTEDIALLVADIKGASLIVSVGTHATLDEFLDRQRSGLSSTFLTRLKVGPRMVDARSVPQLYAGRVRLWHLLLVLVVGLLAVAVAVAATPAGEQWAAELRDAAESLLDQVQGLLS